MPSQHHTAQQTEMVPHTSHWGAFEAAVRDDKVVEIIPSPADQAPAQFLSSTRDALYSPLRVTRPAVRRGWLERGHRVGGAGRGQEEFVEVPWEVAFDLVADELRRVIEEHGNSAIFGGSYGWASAGRFHHAKSQLARFLNTLGGCTKQVQNYSYAAASVVLPHVLGSGAMAAGEVTTWDQIEAATDTWVAFGGIPLRTAQVESGGTATHDAGSWLRRIRDSGTHFAAITPLRDDVPAEVGATWLAPRPGTDTALMLGLAHELVVRGDADEEFLDRYCAGWPRLWAYLTGDVDGTPKTLGWAARIADVSEGELRSLVTRMASGRTLVSATWSLQRAEYGEQPFWAAVALACVLGQVGLPGGGFSFAYGNAALIGHRKAEYGSPALPMLTNEAGSFIPVARIADMLLNPGGTYDYDGQRRSYPDTRLIYWAGGNPFHHHQDLNRLVEAWRRPETVVVNEPWWTPTARMADIVLPATTTLERNDIGASTRSLDLTAMKQAIDPVGDARSDYEIFSALAERLGVGEVFTEGRDEMAWLRHIYGVGREGAAAQGTQLPSFDDFWSAGGWTAPPRMSHVPLADFRADPQGRPLATPSGRIELYSEAVADFGYADCPGHPAWLEPTEWLGSTGAQRHPFHLISNQPATRLHSQLDMGRASQASKVHGREPMRMHPADARARGLADGDVVLVHNDRGSCLVGLRLDDAVRVGVVQLSTGAWFDPVSPELEAHGNPNVLTHDRGTSRLSQGPAAQSALVQVDRYDGALPEVRTLTPPPIRPLTDLSPTTAATQSEGEV